MHPEPELATRTVAASAQANKHKSWSSPRHHLNERNKVQSVNMEVGAYDCL